MGDKYTATVLLRIGILSRQAKLGRRGNLCERMSTEALSGDMANDRLPPQEGRQSHMGLKPSNHRCAFGDGQLARNDVLPQNAKVAGFRTLSWATVEEAVADVEISKEK